MHIFCLQEETIILEPGEHAVIVQSLWFLWELNSSHKHECTSANLREMQGFQLCRDNRKQ